MQGGPVPSQENSLRDSAPETGERCPVFVVNATKNTY